MENTPQINSSYMLQSSQEFLHMWKKNSIHIFKVLILQVLFCTLTFKYQWNKLHAVILLFAIN